MAQFPKREADVVVLAQSLIQGLTARADLFPKPPFSPEEIQEKLTGYLSARDAATAAAAKAQEATTFKGDALETLTDGMKAILRYAEAVANGNEQLAHLGWAHRSTPTALETPGQCRLLEVRRRGDGWVHLVWKEPAEGGKPGAFQIERRELPDGAWSPAGTTLEPEATLVEQPRGKTLEYRVHAMNKAGNGLVSNVVEVIL